jgi:hypothetical protein
LKRGDTINLLLQLKRRYCKYFLNQDENENIFSFIDPYITALEKVFNLFSKIHKNSTEDDLLLQIINPINPQDTKDICLFIKESFTKRETFKGSSLSSS